MPEIIKNRVIVEDEWTVIPDTSPIPDSGRVLISWPRWLEAFASSDGDTRRIGVIADGDVDPDQLGAFASRLDIIALHVPKFTDGRHYSTARLLRERFGYQGELRAIGDVVPDQVFYMHRVGYDAFALPSGPRLRAALDALRTFSVTYQGAVHGRPLHRARA